MPAISPDQPPGNTSTPEGYNEARRLKRCFQRVVSGLEKGGELRLVTLTSSNDAPADIQRSWRRLIGRLRRRALVRDYIKVIEIADDGRMHIHLIFRGTYIQQAYLSHLWSVINNSPVVDIRRVKQGYKDKGNVANYLAKYMSKESARRYSWSHYWVYPGFVKTWQEAKRIIRLRQPVISYGGAFKHLLRLWRVHLRKKTDPQTFLLFLMAHPKITAPVSRVSLSKTGGWA